MELEKNREKYNYYKNNFLNYFDGCYGMNPEPNTPSTYGMGLCKIDYTEKENLLIVHVRRPGVLIGKGGETFNNLKKYLNCNIEIKEVIF
jgi:hypothetical protein